MIQPEFQATVIDTIPELLYLFGRVPESVVRDALCRRTEHPADTSPPRSDQAGLRFAVLIRWLYRMGTDRDDRDDDHWGDDTNVDDAVRWREIVAALWSVLPPDGESDPFFVVGWERWMRTVCAFCDGHVHPMAEMDPHALDLLSVMYLHHHHHHHHLVATVWTPAWQDVILRWLLTTIPEPCLGMPQASQHLLADGKMIPELFGHERIVQYSGGHPVMMGLLQAWERAGIDPMTWLGDESWDMIRMVVTHTIGPREAVVSWYRQRSAENPAESPPVMITQWITPGWLEQKGGTWRATDPRVEEIPMHDPTTGRTWMAARAIPVQSGLPSAWEIIHDVIRQRDWQAFHAIFGLTLKLYPLRGMPVVAADALSRAMEHGMPVSHAEQIWENVLKSAVLTTDRYADLTVEAAVHLLRVPWPVGDPRCRRPGWDGYVARMQALLRAAWNLSRRSTTLLIVNYQLCAWLAYSYPALLDAETYVSEHPTEHERADAASIAAFVRRCCRWVHTGLAPYELDVQHDSHPITSAVVLASIRAAPLLDVLDGTDAADLPYTLAWHIVSSHDIRVDGSDSAWTIPMSVARMGGVIDAVPAEGVICAHLRMEAVWRRPRLEWALFHHVHATRLTMIGGCARSTVWIKTVIRDGWAGRVDMTESIWEGCTWMHSIFRSVSFHRALLIGADVRSTTMDHVVMDQAGVIGGTYDTTTWIEPRMQHSRWYRTTITGSRFTGGTVEGSVFRDCLITDTIWDGVAGLETVDWIGTTFVRVSLPPGIRGHTIRTIPIPSQWSETESPAVLIIVLRTPDLDPAVLDAAHLLRESLDDLIDGLHADYAAVLGSRGSERADGDADPAPDGSDGASPHADTERFQRLRAALATVEQCLTIVPPFASVPTATVLSVPGVYRIQHDPTTGTYTVHLTEYFAEVVREMVDLIITYAAHPAAPPYETVRRAWTDHIGTWIIERIERLRTLAQHHHPWAVAHAAWIQAILIPDAPHPRGNRPWLVSVRDGEAGKAVEIRRESLAWCHCPLLDLPPIPQPEPPTWMTVTMTDPSERDEPDRWLSDEPNEPDEPTEPVATGS